MSIYYDTKYSNSNKEYQRNSRHYSEETILLQTEKERVAEYAHEIDKDHRELLAENDVASLDKDVEKRSSDSSGEEESLQEDAKSELAPKAKDAATTKDKGETSSLPEGPKTDKPLSEILLHKKTSHVDAFNTQKDPSSSNISTK